MKTTGKEPIITPEIIDRMVERIVERFHPDKIVLFGSCARGEITYDSDVDLLVIMPFEGSRREHVLAIYKGVRDFHVPKDLLLYTPSEIDRYKDYVGTIIQPVMEEGKVVYERNNR